MEVRNHCYKSTSQVQYISGIFLVRRGEFEKKRRDRKKYCDKGLQEEEKEMVNLWEVDNS